MRPLRVIHRNQGLRLVVNALFSTLPPMFNVILVSGIFLVVYSILGTHFFKDGFHYCTSLTPADLGSVRHKDDCFSSGGDWLNARSNFDNVGKSLLTLF